MLFGWDDDKEEEVRAARGFGFADAAGIFLNRTVEWQDDRHDYGEARMIAVGAFEGVSYTVAYTDRGTAPSDHHGMAFRALRTAALGKISLTEVRTRAATVDRAKLDATTEEDIRRYKAADGYANLAPPAAVRVVYPPRDLRERLGLTQQAMADALRIPVGTWRNWEQGRVALDPAARSLLAIVQADPKAAFSALAK